MRLESQRNQTGARLNNAHTETCRNVIAKACRTHLRNGFTTGGNDQRFGRNGAAGMPDDETSIGLLDVLDRCFEQQSCTMALHFIKQHIDDLRCGTIAKQLAKRLLVISDAVLLHELDEIALRITA